eukprot:2371497-Pyramimonas_sp.AAC.1
MDMRSVCRTWTVTCMCHPKLRGNQQELWHTDHAGIGMVCPRSGTCYSRFGQRQLPSDRHDDGEERGLRNPAWASNNARHHSNMCAFPPPLPRPRPYPYHTDGTDDDSDEIVLLVPMIPTC